MLSKDFTEPHYSTIIFRPYLIWMEEKLGVERGRTIVDKTGVPWAYLEDDSNWVSEKFVDRFYDVLDIEIGGDHSYQAAKLTFNPKVQGLFQSLALQLATPSIAYKNIVKYVKNVNKRDMVSINKFERGRIDITVTSKRKTKHMKHIADSWAACFEVLPTIYGLPAAHVEYSIDGHAVDFNVEWIEKKAFKWLRIIFTLLFMGGGLFFCYESLQWFLTKSVDMNHLVLLMMILFGMIIVNFIDSKLRRKLVPFYAEEIHKFLESSKEKNQKLHEALVKLDRRYQEANLLAGVIRRIAESENIDHIIEITISEIKNSLGYDRVILFMQEGHFLSVKSSIGMPPNIEEILKKYKIDLEEVTDSPNHLGNLFKNRGSMLIPATREYIESLSEEGKKLVTLIGSRSFLATCIATSDQVFGILLVDYAQTDSTVDQDDLHIIKNIANQIALSISGIYQIEKERFMRSHFQSFVPLKVVSDIVNSAKGDSPEMLTFYHNITVLFSDIRKYTKIAVNRTEEEAEKNLCKAINYYFERMAEIVYHNGGIIDKHIGDAIFAIFNAFEDCKNHELKAIYTAFKMQHDVKEVNEYIRSHIDEGWDDINIGISLHSGKASLGNFGSRYKKEFTAFGHTVNVGSRVESLCKTFGDSVIVITATLHDLAIKHFDLEDLGVHELRGMDEKINLYRVDSVKDIHRLTQELSDANET